MKALVLISLLFAFQAMAEDVEMMKIKSDIDTSQSATVSIQTLGDQAIKSISYEADSQPEKVYPVEKLNKSRVTLIKHGPVAVLEMSTQAVSPRNIILSVRYLRKFSLLGSERQIKKLQMYYLAPSNHYETRDLDTQKVVRNAYAYVRYDKEGKAQGIDRIETW